MDFVCARNLVLNLSLNLVNFLAINYAFKINFKDKNASQRERERDDKLKNILKTHTNLWRKNFAKFHTNSSLKEIYANLKEFYTHLKLKEIHTNSSLNLACKSQSYVLPTLVLLAPSAAFAYLDPASGSLLLSSIVAIFASIVFTLKNVFYKFGSFSAAFANLVGNFSTNAKIPKPSKLVFYCEGAQYYLHSGYDSINIPVHTSRPDALFLFKDFNAKGEIKIDNRLMANYDAPSIFCDNLKFGCDKVPKNALKNYDFNRKVIHTLPISFILEKHEKNKWLIYKAYEVKGSIYDEKSWIDVSEKIANSPQMVDY